MDLLLDSWCRYQYTCPNNPKSWSSDRIRIASLYIVSLRINADRHSIRSTSRRGYTDFLPSQHSVSYRCVYWSSNHMATPREPPTIRWSTSFGTAFSHVVHCTLYPNLPGIKCCTYVVFGCTSCDCVHPGMVAFERVLENTVSNILSRVCVTTDVSP